MQTIDGRALAETIKDSIVQEVQALGGRRPNLAIILIGEREDSQIYVRLKEREAKAVGIDTHLYRCPSNISEAEIFSMIDFLNKDETIDAILVQLPLPAGFDTDGIIMAVNPGKDVDGFHPDNLRILFSSCNHDHVIPPVLKVVLEILKSINCDIAEKNICIIANSEIFGAAMAKVLECRKGRTTVVKADDQDLQEKTKQADILISAVGRPRLIKKKMLKNDAVIIDIGISRENGKICGDVDFADVNNLDGYITPVPGGVGPITIAMALQNTLELHKYWKTHSSWNKHIKYESGSRN